MDRRPLCLFDAMPFVALPLCLVASGALLRATSARAPERATVVLATRFILAAPLTRFKRTMALAAVLEALAAHATTRGLEARLPAAARSARALASRAPDHATMFSATRFILAAPLAPFKRTVALAAVLEALTAHATTRGALARRRALRPHAPPACSSRAHASKILTWTV